ncbi:peptidoglycan-binding protein [Streptomyces sp. NPDC059761]|uniref:peptidoglycan-binding protein n=1 Tax=Streptomyces sp. NPDC059761 TaxID=3346937 RepID=UPI003662E222
MSLETMVAQAEKSLGLGEPNHIQDWYRERNGDDYSGNFAWCDAAVSYWAAQAGERDAVLFGTDYAYTVAHAARFREAGTWTAMTHGIAASGIRRGDIVFFDWDGSSEVGAIDHVGIVTGVSGGNVYTIEGNTLNVCARRVRGVEVIAGFGRPQYSESTSGNGGAQPTGVARYKVAINGLEYGFGARGPQVTAVGAALVARGFGGHYSEGPGPEWSDADTLNYSEYQKSIGLSGDDADGIPGAKSLQQLLGSLPAPAPKSAPPFPGRDKFVLGARNAYAKQLQTWLHQGDWGPRYKVGPSETMSQMDLAKVKALQQHYLSVLGPADGLTGPKTWQYAWEVANGQRSK